MWKIMIYLWKHVPGGTTGINVKYGLDEEELRLELDKWNKQLPDIWKYEVLAIHVLKDEPDLDFESEYGRLRFFSKIGA